MPLTDDARAAVKQEVHAEVVALLKTWGSIVGLVNIAAVAAMLIYVFLVVPRNAATEARGILNEQIAGIQGDVVAKSSTAFIAIGSVQGRAEVIGSTLDTLQAQMNRNTSNLQSISADIATLSNSDRVTVGRVLRSLQEYPSAAAITRQIAELRRTTENINRQLVVSRATADSVTVLALRLEEQSADQRNLIMVLRSEIARLRR
jgi:hypothetical protein